MYIHSFNVVGGLLNLSFCLLGEMYGNVFYMY